MVRDVSGGNLTLRAMGLVYVTILSIVPLIAISFSVLKGFGFHREVEPLLYNLLEPLGERGAELTDRVMGFVENVQGDVLAGAGLVMLFVTSMSMAQKVEDSFNFIWRVEHSRNVAERVTEYLSVIMLGPVVMVTALALIAALQSTTVIQQLTGVAPIGTLFYLAGMVAPYVLVALAFAFIYWFLPNTRVRPGAAIVGGVAGGVLWAASGELFAAFVADSTRTLNIYATFAIVIIALIWLYVCWLVLLVGAQIAFYRQHPEQLRIGYGPLRIGNRQREQIALAVMADVAAGFRAGRAAPRLDSLATRLGLPPLVVSPTVERLVDAGLVARGADGGLLPRRDPGTIRLNEVVAAVRGPAAAARHVPARWPAAVSAVSADVDAALDATLGRRSVYELVDGGPAGENGDDAARRPGV